MFAPTYFAPTYFAPRYFPPGPISEVVTPARKAGGGGGYYYDLYVRRYEIKKTEKERILEEIYSLLEAKGETEAVISRVVSSSAKGNLKKIKNLQARKQVRQLKTELIEIEKALANISEQLSEIKSGGFDDDDDAAAILLIA